MHNGVADVGAAPGWLASRGKQSGNARDSAGVKKGKLFIDEKEEM
nr:hypothetical protein [Pedobacter schmidteae]